MIFVNDNNETLEVISKIAITKQAVSLFSFKIKGDVSVNFTIPNNSDTRAKLNYEGPQMLNQVAFTRQSWNLMDDGNIYMRGYIVIQSDDNKELDCYFVSGNSNWINLLTGIITNIDWSYYSLPLTVSSITSQASATSGMVFPMVDWNWGFQKGYTRWYMQGGLNRITDSSLNYNENFIFDFYPCLFIKTLVFEILQQNGLKISGNLINDPLYNTLVITPSNGQLRRTPFRDILLQSTSFTLTAVNVMQKFTTLSVVSDPESLFSTVNQYITFHDNRGLIFTITIISCDHPQLSAAIFKNGVQLTTFSSGYLSVGSSYSTQLVTVIPNDVIDLRVECDGAPVPPAHIVVNLKVSNPDTIQPGDWVDPSNFLPSYSCVDVIKFIVNYFGCCVYYDSFSKTLTFNIIENLKIENYLDWSQYYLSNRSEYTVVQAKNNYMRLQHSDGDLQIDKFNKFNKKKFGDGIIETNNDLIQENNLFEIPFAPSAFDRDINGSWLTSVPLCNFSDSAAIAYDTITDLGGGLCRFHILSTISLSAIAANQVIRITDNTNQNLGYFVGLQSTSTSFDVYFPFSSTFSGNLYQQSISFDDITPRLLVYKPSTLYSDFTSDLNGTKPLNKSGFYLVPFSSSESLTTTVGYAFYCKRKTSEIIDRFSGNAAFDNPVLDSVDPTVNQLYFNKISSILNNPNIRTQMLLPKSVYQSFDFSSFIYIKSEKLTGYFFVDSIVNYQDASTPVEVNLYML